LSTHKEKIPGNIVFKS